MMLQMYNCGLKLCENVCLSQQSLLRMSVITINAAIGYGEASAQWYTRHWIMNSPLFCFLFSVPVCLDANKTGFEVETVMDCDVLAVVLDFSMVVIHEICM